MRKIILLTAMLAAFCVLTGCVRKTPDASGTDVSDIPIETIIRSENPVPDPSLSSVSSRHILDSLELCGAFTEDVNSRYPEIQIALPQDELEWYYAELDAPNPAYATLESHLSVLTLRLRQSVHVRIDNIRKMGNPVPEGLYQLLEEYDTRFSLLGW